MKRLSYNLRLNGLMPNLEKSGRSDTEELAAYRMARDPWTHENGNNRPAPHPVADLLEHLGLYFSGKVFDPPLVRDQYHLRPAQIAQDSR